MSDPNNLNPDPLTDEPGAHPVGTGIGAAIGGAGAGIVAGALGGPVGAVVGGVIGAVTGGYAGKVSAELVNPTAEDAYWREAHTREEYYEPSRSYDRDYRPAYMLGWSPAGAAEGRFDAVEPRLRERWDNERGVSTLDWEQARQPVRAAWERTYGSGQYAVGSGSLPAIDASLDNDDVVDVLNDLLESCRDGEQGFRTSAEHAATGDLKELLSRRAADCAMAAAQLEHVVRSYGAEPAEGGTVVGALHRGWVELKAALSSNDDKAVLEECERGEDAMVARYRNALEKPLPASVRVLVQRQAEEAQHHHDEVKILRARYGGAY